MPESSTQRDWLRDAFTTAMERIDLRRVLVHDVRCSDGTLHIRDLHYNLRDHKRVVVVAIGKAAAPMTEVFAAAILPALHADQSLEGIVVGPTPPVQMPEGLRYFAGSHPVPDGVSREAAVAAITLVSSLGADDLVLFLVSGGASAMFEAPLDPAISLEETAAFYQALVHSGLSITQMNTVRKHASAVKGGRLAQLAGRATKCSVLIDDVSSSTDISSYADVPGNALDVIASGPSLPDPSTLEDCRAILSSTKLGAALSETMRAFFASADLQETPKPGDGAFENAAVVCLLSNDTILSETRTLAEQAGYHVVIDNTCDDWDYREAADYLLDRMASLRASHEHVCLLSGGEVSVEISGPGGTGGRNQHFALYCALRLSATQQPVTVLSGGTDGIDGNSPAAGAVVDELTVARAQALGLDPAQALAHFDSYPLFAALGDAIVIGPTGNNVRDLRVLVSSAR